jgi:HK97 family phage portal protein
MNNDKAKAFYNDYTALYAGAENAGKSPFIWGGVTWKAAGFTNQDAELLLNRNFEKSEIAGWFRIPEVLLGNTEKTSSWGTGIEQLTRGFVTFTLAPWATNWEQELNLSLLSAEERKDGYFFKFDFSELLRGSLTEQADYLQKLWNTGSVTANEIRRVFHFEERADGPANLTYVPANFVESGTKPANAASPPAKPAAVPGAES